MAVRKKVVLDGNEATASVAHRINEVIAIYPITPSSGMASSPTSGRRAETATSGEPSPRSPSCSRKAARREPSTALSRPVR